MAGFRRQKIVWSEVEVDWLKANRDKMPITQLAGKLSKSRNAVKVKLAELDGKPIAKKKKAKNSISKIGRRKDCDNHFFRSAWEADCYRFIKHLQQHRQVLNGLDKQIRSIEVEPHTFTFTQFGHTHGTIAYTPDLRVSNTIDYVWIEVKGWLDAQDKTRIRRLKKYYPNEFKKLVAITGSPNTAATKFFEEMGVPVIYYINELKKQWRDVIPNWETK